MGRSQMPPLSLWLKGSETEPNAKSVPTSSHRNSFTHPCDHDQGKSCYLIPGYDYVYMYQCIWALLRLDFRLSARRARGAQTA